MARDSGVLSWSSSFASALAPNVRLAASLAAAGLIAAGCGGAEVVPPETTTEELTPAETAAPDLGACRPGTPAPVTERALTDAFAAEGIVLHRDDDCAAEELMTLVNITIPMPSERRDALRASQGSIFCDLLARQLGSRIERFVWRNDPDPTSIRVLNVACSVYPERRAHSDAVERALRRLPGVSDEPALVPSPDARPD